MSDPAGGGKKKKWDYAAAAGILLLINLLLLCRISRLYGERNLTVLSFPAGTVTEAAFGQMLETEESQMFSEAAAWGSLGKAEVSEENSGRRQTVSCYQMKGQPSAVFGKHLLCGRYFTEGETEVCLLDGDSAQQLFGTKDVIGLEIRLGEASYRIAGLLKGQTPVCVIPAGTDSVFDGVAVRKRDAGQSSKLAVNVLEVHFGSTDGQPIDGQLYYVTACLLYAAVTAILFLLAGVRSGRRKIRPRPEKQAARAVRLCPRSEKRAARAVCLRPEKRAVRGVRLRSEKRTVRAGSLCPAGQLLCLAAAAAALAAGVRLAAPGSDYLPTYWADFDFFSQLFQEKLAQVQSLVRYQEFSSWGDILKNWQQAIGAEIFLLATGIIALLNGIGRD